MLLDKHILPYLGEVALGHIEPATIERWYGTLGRVTTVGQRAKAYRLVNTVLNHAVKNQRIVRNPCMIDRGGQDLARGPVATIPQVFALAHAMPERLSVVVLVAAFGSLRMGEVAGLTRGDVDVDTGCVRVARQVQRLDSGEIVICEPKAGSRRTVTLPEQIMDTLIEHMVAFTGAGPEDHVFTRPHGNPLIHHYVDRRWRVARAAAGLEAGGPSSCSDLIPSGAVGEEGRMRIDLYPGTFDPVTDGTWTSSAGLWSWSTGWSLA